MPNKNYRRGFVAEDRCLKELRAAGYWAERFHASKGTFDVIATNGIYVRFIQVKRSKKTIISPLSVEHQFKKDLELMRDMPTASELWVWFDGQIKDHVLVRKAGWRKYAVLKVGIVEMKE